MLKVRRTGRRPLKFDGEQIAGSDGRFLSGRAAKRWHEISVFKTASGKYVVAVVYNTQWPGESSYHTAIAVDDLSAVATFLEGYTLYRVGAIGYPPTSVYGQRQAHVMADLEGTFLRLVARVLNQLEVSGRGQASRSPSRSRRRCTEVAHF